MSATYSVDPDTLEPYGYVKVTWTNAGKLGTFYSWRVYRRYPPTSTWTLLYETTSGASSFEYRDWWAKANTSAQYSVVQAYTSGGNIVETTHSPTSVTPSSSHYWLIHPTNANLTLLLAHVTADNFDDEYEEETLNLIGRGRKVDRGERWGVKGSLTVQLRDRPSALASEQLATLRAILEDRGYVHLRTPFGDLWKVTVKSPSFTRVPGVALKPFIDVTLAYEEVA
jgi:hypothetical protein